MRVDVARRAYRAENADVYLGNSDERGGRGGSRVAVGAVRPGAVLPRLRLDVQLRRLRQNPHPFARAVYLPVIGWNRAVLSVIVVSCVSSGVCDSFPEPLAPHGRRHILIMG